MAEAVYPHAQDRVQINGDDFDYGSISVKTGSITSEAGEYTFDGAHEFLDDGPPCASVSVTFPTKASRRQWARLLGLYRPRYIPRRWRKHPNALKRALNRALATKSREEVERVNRRLFEGAPDWLSVETVMDTSQDWRGEFFTRRVIEMRIVRGE